MSVVKVARQASVHFGQVPCRTLRPWPIDRASGMLFVMEALTTDGKAGAPEGGLLDRALAILRARSEELRASGFLHVAVFGSVARREDGPDSDLDLVAEIRLGVDSMDLLIMERSLADHVGREVQIITQCGLDEVRHAEILRDMIPAF
jgi:predicted nucleotidyltransferase